MPDSYREPYKYGFVTPIENESFEKGLNEGIIRRASKIRKEPEFMLTVFLRTRRSTISLIRRSSLTGRFSVL